MKQKSRKWADPRTETRMTFSDNNWVGASDILKLAICEVLLRSCWAPLGQATQVSPPVRRSWSQPKTAS